MHHLTLATYNIHKGVSAFGRRIILPELKNALKGLSPDLIFLQEVGSCDSIFPSAQYEFLAQDLSPHAVYGLNARYRNRHHGNAIISLHPIISWQNHDISINRFEKRGLLHCQVQLPSIAIPLQAICVHLNLLARDRRKQLQFLIDYIELEVPRDACLVIAGDFNDWRVEASAVLAQRLSLYEAFELFQGRPARSFPAKLPMLSLDRIYIRGCSAYEPQALTGAPWDRLSDHLPLAVKLRI